MLKFGIAIAFPGTQMFKENREKGLIKTYNWDICYLGHSALDKTASVMLELGIFKQYYQINGLFGIIIAVFCALVYWYLYFYRNEAN